MNLYDIIGYIESQYIILSRSSGGGGLFLENFRGCLIFEFCCIFMHQSQKFSKFQFFSEGDTSLQRGVCPPCSPQNNVGMHRMYPDSFKNRKNLEISKNLETSGKPEISKNTEISRNIRKYPEIRKCPEIGNIQKSGNFSYLKKGTSFKKAMVILLPLFFVFNKGKKIWISMFFIKFLGRIEKVLCVASNIFNFTLEFDEKHFNPHFYPC